MTAMTRIRTLLNTMLVLICVAVALPAQAVSLGSVKVTSKMGQPFEAIVPIHARTSEGRGLKVKLAHGDDYQKIGVRYKYFLRHIESEMIVDKNLKPTHVRLFSKIPLFQPEIRVILDAVWPDGRFLRGYTILVQPSENIYDVARTAGQGQGNRAGSSRLSGEVFIINEGDPKPSINTPLWNAQPVYKKRARVKKRKSSSVKKGAALATDDPQEIKKKQEELKALRNELKTFKDELEKAQLN